jgi:1,4-dihydroxy-2-naphthoate octaprenyltransferase
VGTTLPLWLRPPGFTFRWIGALEFLVATVLVHSGFSLLHAWFDHRIAQRWTRLLTVAITCIVLASALGLHLMRFTPGLIFIVYGVAVMFAGLLYVAPPVRFSQREGGEIVLSMSLALLPVLGAYLVQAGDLTRTVYLAALPIYAAMLLWVWVEEMARMQARGPLRRETLVSTFGPRVSGRVVVPGLSLLVCVTILIAVLSSSVTPLALAALLSCVPIWKVVAVSWTAYADASKLMRVRTSAFAVHLWICCVLIASSVWAGAN